MNRDNEATDRHAKDTHAKEEAAKRRRLTASSLDAIMTPGVRYTCVALANQLRDKLSILTDK